MIYKKLGLYIDQNGDIFTGTVYYRYGKKGNEWPFTGYSPDLESIMKSFWDRDFEKPLKAIIVDGIMISDDMPITEI